MANEQNVQGLIGGDDKTIARSKNKLARAGKKLKAQYAKTVRILELELEQQKLEMKRDELTLTKPFQLNQIRNSPYIKDEERDELVSKLEINIDEKIRVFNDQINEIQKQQDLISDTPIPEEDIQVTKLKKNNVKAKIKETSYDVKNKLRRKPSFDDIVEAIAFVTTIILENIAINNTKIEKLVDDTNDIIFSVKTQTEFDNAKIKRGTALNIITTNERLLNTIEQILEILSVLTTILTAIIELLSLFPFTLVLNKILLRIQNILIKINPLIRVALSLINKLQENLAEHKARLAQLNNILNGSLADVPALIKGLTQPIAGYLSGYDYKGFKFFIKADNTQGITPPQQIGGFAVQPLQPNYAIAVNRDGNEVLRSSISYTLNPEVLVEELKLIIDQKGLVA
jgi:hypothetical protein